MAKKREEVLNQAGAASEGAAPTVCAHGSLGRQCRVCELEQEVAYWQTCSGCGERMDAPGHCTSGVAEWNKGQMQMLEEAHNERDMWKARAESKVQVIRHEPRAKQLQHAHATIATLRAALAQVEWVDIGVYDAEETCPWCDGLKFAPEPGDRRTQGHATDCARQAALGLKDGER